MAYDIFFADPLIGLQYFLLNLMVLELFRKMYLSYKKNLSVHKINEIRNILYPFYRFSMRYLKIGTIT